MNICKCAQRSPAWYELRTGRFTASTFADLMPAKSKPVDSWTEAQAKAIYATVAERMTGKSAEMFTSYAMQWGIDTEPLARTAYEIHTGTMVDEVGFIEHSDWIGCSPDGLVNDDGMFEAKCSNSDTHLMYCSIPGRLADAYFWQVQGQLWIAQRKWCDLVSFDPRYLDESKRIYIVRINRDEEAIRRLSDRLENAVAIAETIQGEQWTITGNLAHCGNQTAETRMHQSQKGISRLSSGAIKTKKREKKHRIFI